MKQRAAAECDQSGKWRRPAFVKRLRSLRTSVIDAGKDVLARLLRATLGWTVQAGDGRTHVLIVDDLLPDPLFGAGYPRAFEIVHSIIRAGHRVSVYPMASTGADLARMRHLFGGTADFYAGEGVRGLRRLLWRQGKTFDVLFISRPGPMRAWLDLCWMPDQGKAAPAVIYDAEALLAPRERRRRGLFGPAWLDEDYHRALDAELELVAAADAATAVGQQDRDTIAAKRDVPVFILPHPVSAREETVEFGERYDILFVGRLTGPATQSPNVDSLLWFLSEVMPLLDRLIGRDYRFHVAGLVDTPALVKTASDRIVLHGVMEDLAPLYNQCRLFVAPTRFAAGIPLKVVEAMGYGIPCVATPLLAEQLGTQPGELAIAATPEGFAEQCSRLYTDATAWGEARDAARAYVARSCSPAMFDRVLNEVLTKVTTVRHGEPVEMTAAQHSRAAEHRDIVS